ncbi:MAG: hypothetical protein WD055_01150 [Candidatus Dependentiae bacterium]
MKKVIIAMYISISIFASDESKKSLSFSAPEDSRPVQDSLLKNCIAPTPTNTPNHSPRNSISQTEVNVATICVLKKK